MNIFSFALAELTPENPIGQEDKEKIESAVEDIPIDPNTGEVNYSQFDKWKSKAEERITEANTWIGPISKIIFGIELSFSWIFLFTVIIWLVLWEIVRIPIREFMENQWIALSTGAIVSIISMHSWAPSLVALIDEMINIWWIALGAIVCAIIVTFFLYPMLIKKFAGRLEAVKKAEEKMFREEITRFGKNVAETEENLARKKR